MAGRPNLRADLLKLSTLTTGDTDYIMEQVADAVTLYNIAKQFDVTRSALTDWIEASPDRSERLKRARAQRATTHAERALQIAEGGLDPSLPITDAARKNAITTHLWAASRLDRKQYGEQKGPDITINLATLHLDALRHCNTVERVERTQHKVLEARQQDVQGVDNQ